MRFRRRRPKEPGYRGRDMLAAALNEHDGRARARIDRWWAEGGTRRDEVWRGAWILLSEAGFRFGNHERPERVAPVLEFLLEDDPSSPYLPRVRLTSCLPPTAAHIRSPSGVYTGEPDVERLVRAALGFPDLALRRRMADLLSATDQPGLLDALEGAFRLRARPGPTYVGAAPPGHETRCGLWHDGGRPVPLLDIVSANPNLPRPPSDPDDVDLSLLPLLKDRPELLPAFDQAALVLRLLEYLGTWLPEPVHERCRRALRDLSAQEGVTAICDRAVLGDAEAVAAVRDAGYRPDDSAWTTVLLLLTGQFAAYREADPHGRVLQTACGAGASAVEGEVVDRVLALLATNPPDDVAAAVRRSLRDLGPTDSPIEDLRRLFMRTTLLSRAADLEPEAVAAVVDAGYLPEEPEEVLPLLFLTRQFERYDREDPDGTRLRAVLAERRYRYEREHFRKVARQAGRPDPWPPEEPRPPRGRTTGRYGAAGRPATAATPTAPASEPRDPPVLNHRRDLRSQRAC